MEISEPLCVDLETGATSNGLGGCLGQFIVMPQPDGLITSPGGEGGMELVAAFCPNASNVQSLADISEDHSFCDKINGDRDSWSPAIGGGISLQNQGFIVRDRTKTKYFKLWVIDNACPSCPRGIPGMSRGKIKLMGEPLAP